MLESVTVNYLISISFFKYKIRNAFKATQLQEDTMPAMSIVLVNYTFDFY